MIAAARACADDMMKTAWTSVSNVALLPSFAELTRRDSAHRDQDNMAGPLIAGTKALQGIDSIDFHRLFEMTREFTSAALAMMNE